MDVSNTKKCITGNYMYLLYFKAPFVIKIQYLELNFKHTICYGCYKHSNNRFNNDVISTLICSDIKNLDQWICYTNTRYNSLESHMQYMKMLWHEVQPNIPELKKNVHSLGYHNSETKISDSVEAKTPTQMNYNNSLKEFSDNQFSSTNNNGMKKHSTMSLLSC